MYGKTTFEYELEPLAAELIERNPMGFLSEVEFGWPCIIAIHVLESSCLDTPKVIIQCSSQKIRAFETACRRAKAACMQFRSPVSAPSTAAKAI